MPTDDLSEPIEYPAQFEANRPAAFILVLGANLLWGASLSNGKQQFDRKAVDDIHQPRFSQQLIRMILMLMQLTQQGRSIRQASEQSVIIAFQPTVKRPKPSTLQRKQDAYRHNLAWIQFRVAFFRHNTQSVIDST